MRSRLTFILGALTALALVAGAAWAGMPATTETESVIDVADAGTVTVARSASTLEITEVSPAVEWSYEVEIRTGREVEVAFRMGERSIHMSAELEDGEARVRIRERLRSFGAPSSTIGDDPTSASVDHTTSTSTAASSAPTMPAGSTPGTVPASTSTTVDDSSSTSTDDDTTSTTIDDRTSTTMDDDDGTTSTTVGHDDGPKDSGSESYSVGGRTTVTIAWQNGQMSLVSVSLSDGWNITDRDLRSDRIELAFGNGEQDAEFKADFHHGSIRVETKFD